jgi:hypothetical protein
MAGKNKRIDPFRNFNFRVILTAAVAGVAAFVAAKKLTNRRDERS